MLTPIEGYPRQTIAINAISSWITLPLCGMRYIRAQLPLMSANAFSEFKSQSMTLPWVAVEMKCKHFAANGTYVALTRVEGLSGLTIVGRKIAFEDFLVDQPCLQRIRAEYARIQDMEPTTLQQARTILRTRAPRRHAEFISFDE